MTTEWKRSLNPFFIRSVIQIHLAKWLFGALERLNPFFIRSVIQILRLYGTAKLQEVLIPSL